MKTCTSMSKQLNRLPVMWILAVLLIGSVGLETVKAQGYMDIATSNACNAGYSGVWIIGNVCDLGGSINIKTDDAIDIQCDNQTDRWSIDFYEEPADADPNAPASQATRYRLCPGNGYLAKDADGRQVLRCNFWESVDNVAKQLEFELQTITDPNIRAVSWLTRELDNPNVICGIAGRGDDGSASGSGGQTIDGD